MSKVNVVEKRPMINVSYFLSMPSFDSLRRLSFCVYFKMKMKTMTTF